MANADARVLIIENNDALRVMMFTILRHQPLNVDTAVTADEAIEKIMTCDYALILVDTDLPDDEAPEFLRRFHEERPQSTSFVIAVRDPNKESAIDGRVVGAILNKPIEIDTLADVVRECAIVVPRPPDPLPCPPAESEIRTEMDRGSLPN
jgi:DNA-binding response OmpR family regulator